MEDLAYSIVDCAARVNYDDLPKDVVQITKKFILDTIGNIIAGSSALGCKEIFELIKDFGGKEESTILVYGDKVPSPDAAFANSIMAFVRALCDTQDEAGVHAYVVVFPAALAIAERKGNVSGKDFIAATTVGVDLMCRLSLGVVGPLDWALSATAGCFGATMAVGKILGLDKTKLHHAIGIVYSQCSGNWQCVDDRGLVIRLQPAFAAKAGILSCLLAQRGITGAKNIFEGRYGFYPLYFKNKYDRKRILEGLGKVFEGNNLSIKLFPCCRFANSSVEVTLSIVQKNNIKPDDVVEVIAHVTQESYEHAGKPFEIGESPVVDAQFSIPYTTAIAIARGDVFIDDFSVEKIKTDTQVLNLAKKVRVIADQVPIGKGLTPCIVEIKTKDGKVYSQSLGILKGDPRKPVDMEEVGQKFRKCVKFSSNPISTKNIEKIISAVNNLEDVEDVGEVIKLVV